MLAGLHIGASPEALALSILFSTLFLEDAAIGYAAILAATGMIAPLFAFVALFFGIYLGDVGLYFLGTAARHFRFARRLVGEQRIAKASAWFESRSIYALVLARFIPGSRLPVYAASGFLKMPFATFALITATASFVWAAAIFIAVYLLGMEVEDILGDFKYLAAILVVAVIVAASFFSARHFAPQARMRDV